MATFQSMKVDYDTMLKERGLNVHDCRFPQSKEFTPMLPIVEDEEGKYWASDEIKLMSFWVAFCPYCGKKLGDWY